MKALICSIIAFLLIQPTFAQKASDILENGNKMPKRGVIVLQFDTVSKKISYDLVKSLEDPKDNPLNFTELEDSAIFLPFANAVNVYVRPWNPLRYSINQEVSYSPDEINEAGSKIFGTFKDIPKATQTMVSGPANNRTVSVTNAECDNFDVIESKLKQIHGLLKDSKKDSINILFEALRNLSFNDETATVAEIDKNTKLVSSIEKYFSEEAKVIEETRKLIDDYNCDKPKIFSTQYLFYTIIKDFTDVHTEQKKRLKNLQSALSIVTKQRDLALANEKGFRWAIKIDQVSSKPGKIANAIVYAKRTGLYQNADGEILKAEPIELIKRSYRMRKYQKFVPEVSAGTAYTFFKYKTYGTTMNSNNEMVVAEPIENNVRNINLTSMLNMVYYLENSPVQPLWQVGFGINQSIPTLLTGFGLRGALGPNRIAITGGIAMTWLRDLDKLKPGDKVKGTSDIENDLKYTFTFPPKLYIGIQYGF